MSELLNGDNKETDSPAATPAENQTPTPASAEPNGGDTPSDGEGSSSEHMIPKHRFDEVNDQLKELKRSMNETTSKNQKTEATIDALRNALDGGSNVEVDDAVKEIMTKHKLQGADLALVEDILSAAERKVSKKLEASMKPLKAQQVLAAYDKDLRALGEKFPEVSDLSKDEKEEFRKMAFSKEWGSAPLEGVWKAFSYDKPKGNSKTLESSSSGRARSMSDDKSVKDMTLEEFEEYSNSMER